MCISSCTGSCSSFLTPPFIHALLGRVSITRNTVEYEVGQRISIKENLMKNVNVNACEENKLQTASPFGFSDLAKKVSNLYHHFPGFSECASI